ncbi:MAG: hypothetical protein PHE73_09065 [Sulfurovaceae bacterium]|nr:hypothetical protein [Sulfurovaceae bacterium]
MSMPNTLAGIIGFVTFVGIMVALVVPSLPTTGKQLDDATNTFSSKLNSTVNGSSSGTASGFWGFIGEATGVNGVYDFIIGFFQIQIAFIELTLAYLGVYVDIVTTVPTPFYVLFLILFDSLIIGIIKLIFLSGD